MNENLSNRPGIREIVGLLVYPVYSQPEFYHWHPIWSPRAPEPKPGINLEQSGVSQEQSQVEF